MPFDLLFVCTGNLCRSPLAERLLAARLPTGLRSTVHARSAGTHAVVGRAMDAQSADVLRELGGDPDGHRAQQLDPDDLRTAGLVLTATTAQRAMVLQARPSALRRTFTLREFARLADELPPAAGPSADHLAALVRDVAARRGLASAAPPGADEIGDPLGAPLAEARRCGRQIDAALAVVVRVLGG